MFSGLETRVDLYKVNQNGKCDGLEGAFANLSVAGEMPRLFITNPSEMDKSIDQLKALPALMPFNLSFDIRASDQNFLTCIIPTPDGELASVSGTWHAPRTHPDAL